MKSSDHRKTITKRENSKFKFFKISVNFCINFGISSFLGTLRVNPDRTRFARVKIVVATATRGGLNFPASARLNRSSPSPASEWPLLPIRFKSGRATDQLSHQLTWRHSTIYCEIDKCCEFTRIKSWWKVSLISDSISTKCLVMKKRTIAVRPQILVIQVSHLKSKIFWMPAKRRHVVFQFCEILGVKTTWF